ncbi:MAG: hypothetical protein K5669_05090 [Lachnospiraceae bacterium]|nr:hypothetical protein [Lachnospiraceae bacterium]
MHKKTDKTNIKKKINIERIINKSIDYANIKPIGYMAALMCSTLIAGCGFESNMDADASLAGPGVNSQVITMENEAVLDYEVPEMTPGILVDRNGYSSNEIAIAYVFADKMPEEFTVKNSDGEAVATVKPTDIVLNREKGKFFAKLDLSEASENGEYSIYSDSLGSSYDFAISDTFFRDKYWNLIADECEKLANPDTSMWEAYSVLYSYERYKEVLYAEKKDAPDVLGAIVKFIAVTDFKNLKLSDKYVSIALLARFGYNYKAVDEALATECTQKASALYKENADLKELTEEENAAKFLAATELFRTTQAGTYSREILGMREYLENLESMHDSPYILYGAMGYMTTRRGVDRGLCDFLMEDLLYKCRDLNDNKKLIDESKAPKEEAVKLLEYAQQFAAMNYILDGYEYNEQILNIVHYLSGRNISGELYDFAAEDPSDAIPVYAWLAWLENNGKLDPSAPVIWNYSW